MTGVERPSLCIVAGPNGSGKTTTTEQLLKYEWTDNSIYINPDDIAKDDMPEWAKNVEIKFLHVIPGNKIVPFEEMTKN